MSNLAIEEAFDVDAGPDAVFSFLLDPDRLVGCMPGAELLAVESERVFRGKVRVKVGTVAIGYEGRIELTHVDAVAHALDAEGEGREKGGAGKVGVALQVRVEPLDVGRSRVAVAAQVKLAGRIVRFGRGLVDAVSKELFAEFARAVVERVPASAAAPAQDGAPATPDARDAAASAPVETTPIRAIPLLWRSLLRWLRRLLGRAD